MSSVTDSKTKFLLERFVRVYTEQADTNPKGKSKLSKSQIFRRAVGFAIADQSKGVFAYSPPTSSISEVRLNPVDDKASDLDEKMITIINEGVNGLSTTGVVLPGGDGARSGKFPTFPLIIDDPGKFFALNQPWMVKTLDWLSKVDNLRQKYLLDPTQRHGIPQALDDGDLPTRENIVLKSQSLASNLFTGQGLGNLAEYATAAAINGSDEFERAVGGAILSPSWNQIPEDSPVAEKFRNIYDQMVNAVKISIAIAEKRAKVDFGSNATVAAGGGANVALYDVTTSTANIHIKFAKTGKMSRLAGIRQEFESDVKPEERLGKDAPLIDQLEQLKLGQSDRYWRVYREQFKDALQLKIKDPKKDKEALREYGFYEWLLGLSFKLPPDMTWQDITPEHKQWLESERPNFKEALLQDIKSEWIDKPRTEEKGFYYFTYKPAGGKLEEGTLTFKVIIEQVGIFDESMMPEFDVIMHPDYVSGNQIGFPYQLIDKNNPQQPFMDLEFRAKGASKPIQLHRAAGFSSTMDSDETGMVRVIAELRRLIRKIILESPQ